MEKIVSLIDEEMIQQRVKQLAKKINQDYEGKDVTLICILKGAIYFFCDITRQLKLNAKTELIRVSSYEGTSSTGNLKLKLGLDEPVTGKDVIIIEDIIDTGKTLSYLIDYLKEQNPNSLKLCAFLDKPERRVVHNVVVDYTGFTIPNFFVVGYGMDLDEKYRNIPCVSCIIHPEDEEMIEKEKEKLKEKINLLEN